jgi:hypothetical protein
LDFRYSLLENGLDFVHSSLDHLTAARAARDNHLLDLGQHEGVKIVTPREFLEMQAHASRNR